MLVISFSILLLVLAASFLAICGRRDEGLGLPLGVILIFTFLYVVQPVYLWRIGALGLFLPASLVAKGALVPAPMMACFMLGWYRRKRKRIVPTESASWNPRTLYRFGMFTAAIGVVLFSVFIARSGGIMEAFSKPHGSAASWATNTAYLYHSPWWILCGLAMMIVAAARMRARFVVVGSIVVLSLLMYALTTLLASRGYFFATTACILVSTCLAKRIRPSVMTALLVSVVTLFGVLLMVGFRNVLYLGEKPHQAPTLSDALAFGAAGIDPHHIGKGAIGTEFVFHAAAIDTVDQLQRYHKGINWIYAITVHVIPRLLWPDKPYSFETSGITWEDIGERSGVEIAGGSAPGIVADIYMQFGILSLIFFFVFGRLARRLYSGALEVGSPQAICIYVLFYSLTLNTFAQGFGALIVPFLYSLIPVVAYTMLGRSPSGQASAESRKLAAARMRAFGAVGRSEG